MKILSLHHILLPVCDVEAAAIFYENLGMERISALNPKMRWLQFGPNQLHLWPDDALHGYNGWNHEPSPHFALIGDDIEAFARLIPHIGGQILQAPKQRPNGTWYLFALDLDGNRFEIMQVQAEEQRSRGAEEVRAITTALSLRQPHLLCSSAPPLLRSSAPPLLLTVTQA